jgi:hypothetical protein
MRERRLRQALQDIAAEAVREPADLWPKIQAQITSRPRQRRLVPASGMGWIVLGLILVLAFSTVAYAAITSFLDRAVQMDPHGSQFLIEQGWVEELELSQTTKGITVTLNWAYADVNRIVIAYTVKHSGDRCQSSLSLTDNHGSDFPPILGGYGYHGDGLSGQVLSFDAGSMYSAPERLDLRLKVQVSPFDLPNENPTPTAAIPDSETGAAFAEAQPMRVNPPEATFEFDFTVPFHPGRDIEVRQSQQAAGLEVTLEQVTLAPSDARFRFCFVGLDPDAENWTPLLTLQAGTDWADEREWVLQGGRWVGESCYEHHFAAPLQEQPGTWTVTITEMIGDKRMASNSENGPSYTYQQIRIRGPWTFQFHAP